MFALRVCTCDRPVLFFCVRVFCFELHRITRSQCRATCSTAMEKDTDVYFLELLQKGLNRFKKAPPKKNKVKDGYHADKAKEAAPPSTEILSRVGSLPKDNLFERVPSTLSRLDTNRSGRSEGDANPSTRPASGKSQKSGRWDSIRSMVKSNPASKAGSQAGSQAGSLFWKKHKRMHMHM